MTRKRLSILNIWLGLFAMLMVHVGPLYSAFSLQGATVGPAEHAGHTDSEHGHHGHHSPPSPVPHHGSPIRNTPEWLQALELCGYCELLTLNPPLTMPLELVLPRHEPASFEPLPTEALPPPPRRANGQARAPPPTHS